MRKKVLLTKKLSPELTSMLQPFAELITISDNQQHLFDQALIDVDAVILSTAYEIDQKRILTARNLRVISRTGVGVDNVDIDAASTAGILILNTPTANSETVAEHAVAMILALVKQLAWLDRETRLGNFAIRRKNLGHDLSGRILGLIGCGRIGQLVASNLQHGFGLSVVAYDPYLQPVAGIKFVESLEELLQTADIISLHLPLIDSTRNLLSKQKLALLKPDAYLINTSRGGLIDEQALAHMLQNNQLAGAALDVFSNEPLEKDNPLIYCPNTLLTPHSAALTQECNDRVAHQAVQGIVDYFNSRQPNYVVNKDRLEASWFKS